MVSPIVRHSFAADVGRVLELVINSIYTNKEIFLRELISNASDACDKLRYKSIHDSNISNDQGFKITIKIDKANNTLSIIDNGIGMDAADMISNLGTIANSGTKKFLEQLSSSKGGLDLIGQFGVGFYSAFMVSEFISVYSKKAGQDKIFLWESNGRDDYSISESYENQGMGDSGTVVQLKLMPEYVEFLEDYRIKYIVKTYCDHILFPIELRGEKDDFEIINSSSALWLRSSSNITEEEYQEFYKSISHMPDKPWMVLHNKIEGKLTYTNLLFIPSKKPFDLFSPKAKPRVKLYVKRVFINEEGLNFIPTYLRFLSGVIDSEDLPLNISRETLQNNITLSQIKKSILKRVLNALQKKSNDDIQSFEEFWNDFGEVLKEGLCEGAFEEKEQLLDICRFYSLKFQDKTISLSDYVADMVEAQEEIYYIIGGSKEILVNHPQLQGFKKRGIDVLLLSDHVDDFWVNVVNQYKNYPLKSVTSSNIDLNKVDKPDLQENNNSDSKLIQYIKSVLKDNVKDVQVSTKLIDNPVCLVIPDGAMNIRMEKILIEQKQLQKKSNKILEINADHPILHKISNYIDNGSVKANDLIWILFNQACILEGEPIDDPYSFVSKINSLL